MAGVDFSVPATDGSASHATSQTSLFLYIPGPPVGDMCIWDYNLRGGNYYRLNLTSGRHLSLQFSLTDYGSATADLGLVSPSTWTWISCGFSTSGGLRIRGDVTPLGGATVTTSALASSGSETGTTLSACSFGDGVPLTSGALEFPNDVEGMWLKSRLVQDQITADDAGGNPRPIPTVDFLPGTAYREYLAHDPLGTALTLSDSGTGALDMTAGAQGLTLASAGPPLVSGASAPAGHQGDIQVYISGTWTAVAAGTPGQVLTVGLDGVPAWA